ncbi:MAG: hypothetical protein MUE41_17490, partial [Gemmatimonadaceae bacterium]|nr:hypothetical protein [Gemmatimonadaceae bacterium]
PDLGYVRGRAPVDGAFTTALEAELAAMAAFLGVAAPGGDGGARDAFDRDVGAGARSTGARRAGVRDEASRAGSP